MNPILQLGHIFVKINLNNSKTNSFTYPINSFQAGFDSVVIQSNSYTSKIKSSSFFNRFSKTIKSITDPRRKVSTLDSAKTVTSFFSHPFRETNKTKKKSNSPCPASNKPVEIEGCALCGAWRTA